MKHAQIHIVGKPENIITDEVNAREIILDYLRNGYGISCSVYSPDDNTVYVTLAKSEDLEK